jgi:iron complex outermembrane receptor protein
MKRRFTVIYFIILSFLSYSSFAKNTLSGIVSDKKTGKPLAGAVIYVEDLKIGAISNSEGSYSLKDLPIGTYIVTARYIGYALETRLVTIKGFVEENFSLVSTPYEQNEVVVTGNSMASELQSTPQPITIVTKDYLNQNASTNIIDAISKIPGVSGITDGQSISKPVIRGLGYNRVVTVNDGVRQEGQQWGDEFGIEIDPNSVDRVEILKGPGTLVYGSDAISGVINFLPEETAPEGVVKGDVTTGYQTNNGLINTAGHITGTLDGISFSGRIDNTMAHAYQNKDDGYVFNSQFSNFNTDATIGIHRKWGYSQLHYSYFELRTGIVEGAKDSSGAFLIQTLDDNGEPSDRAATNQELRSYTPFLINQLVRHKKLVWDNSFEAGKGRILARFAWQQNSRQENNDITIPNTSNIWYFLNTYNYDLRYVSPTRNDFDYSIGLNGMSQNSQNKGTLLLIPEYNLFDLGAFAIVNKKIGKWNISGGLRYDTRSFNGKDDYVDSNGNQLSASDPDAIHQFTAYTSNFTGVSGSLGATYQFSKNVYLKANIARGFRAPNVAETGSNGIHDGTVIYEIGQPNLKPENSLEFDLTPGITSKNITAEASVFYNSITNFIYAKGLNSAFGGDSLNNSNPAFPDASVFLYDQTNAVMYGAEVMLDIHPTSIKWFDWYTAFSTVNTSLQNVPDSVKYIPFVPPARLRSDITINCKKLSKAMRNSYFRIGLYYSFEQSNVYQQANKYAGVPDVVPVTPAYTLINAGLGTDIMNGKRKALSVYVSLDNIADVSYTDYMSRFKYYSNMVNGQNQVGVRNMGRNISFKVIIPIDFKSK